jgi:hypothetical protein
MKVTLGSSDVLKASNTESMKTVWRMKCFYWFVASGCVMRSEKVWKSEARMVSGAADFEHSGK